MRSAIVAVALALAALARAEPASADEVLATINGGYEARGSRIRFHLDGDHVAWWVGDSGGRMPGAQMRFEMDGKVVRFFCTAGDCVDTCTRADGCDDAPVGSSKTLLSPGGADASVIGSFERLAALAAANPPAPRVEVEVTPTGDPHLATAREMMAAFQARLPEVGTAARRASDVMERTDTATTLDGLLVVFGDVRREIAALHALHVELEQENTDVRAYADAHRVDLGADRARLLRIYEGLVMSRYMLDLYLQSMPSESAWRAMDQPEATRRIADLNELWRKAIEALRGIEG